MQEGNYIALEATAEDATSISVRPLGSTQAPATLDSDGIYILRVVKAKGVEYHTVVDGVEYVNIYRFTNLTLEKDED